MSVRGVPMPQHRHWQRNGYPPGIRQRGRRQPDTQGGKVGPFPVAVKPVFMFEKREFVFPQSQDIDLPESSLFQIDGRQDCNPFLIFRLKVQGYTLP